MIYVIFLLIYDICLEVIGYGDLETPLYWILFVLLLLIGTTIDSCKKAWRRRR